MLGGMLKDSPDGKVSMMRVCTFIIVVAVMGVYVMQNILSAIKGAGMIPVGWTEVSLLGGALGFKAFQVTQEGSSSTPPVNNTVVEDASKK
jgi:hypothetical protein